MTATVSHHSPSGIDVVDAQWGGLAPGRSLLLVGRAGAGRTALALKAVQATAEAGQTAVLLSPKTPQDLRAAADTAGFDLAAMHRSGHVRVLRIPSAKDLAAKGNSGMEAAYRDLAGLAQRAGAERVVIEDFTPLVQFTTFEALTGAFETLRDALTGERGALVLGMGEPGNEPSRKLVAAIEERVDGTVRIRAGGEASFTSRAPSAPDAGIPDAAFDPPTDKELEAPTPEDSPAPSPPREEPAAEVTPPLEAPAPSLADQPPTLSAPEPADPFATMPLPGAPSNDGASLDVHAPSQVAPPASGGLAQSGVRPADAPDPGLLSPVADRFHNDPGAAFFAAGYLIDSRAQKAPSAAAQANAPLPAPEPETEPEPAAPAPAPPPSASGETAARKALAAAFGDRALGAPFLVVAARMDPAQPEAAHFGAVADGLRSATPPSGAFYADRDRLRSLLIAPGASPEAATDVFAALQKHLVGTLGAEAEATLRAVAAITVPNGDPFETADELWRYAVEQ